MAILEKSLIFTVFHLNRRNSRHLQKDHAMFSTAQSFPHHSLSQLLQYWFDPDYVFIIS